MAIVNKTVRKRITREEKRYLLERANKENLAAAINILENIHANFSYKISKNSRNSMDRLVFMLNCEDKKMPLSVRAANAIGIIDCMTQDGRLDPLVRTMLWRVVSNLDGIRD